ncbi:JAB domain-containing protein [Alkalibacter saccharofermentans]|uniref:DNA repair protein RadC n=1 Tax=Alkalibacter saccharofermentans DSM 14828 TaxID=1120975 RepID=A0A1M4YK82_9FIRM|nr:DNA repair protein RadC [Alkalibacter saccharofermentans]SHF06214.1 DNA repair protein RadC [Alkalibacter saccharofermentans DSM 14828]
MSQKIHTGHRQRMKNRYIKEGLDHFEDHQVLEMLLFFSVPRKDTNELAHRMLKEFGSLSTLFESTPEEISRRCDVTQNTAVLVSMIPSLAKRYFKGRWGEKPLLNSSTKAGQYAVSLFTGLKYEAFYIICLDSQNKASHAAKVHEGTINEAPVYPRLIVETALRHQANSVILSHNHPGGSLKPSNADIEVTKRIISAMEAISIKVVDHIIVAGELYYSFAENGRL